ncbi:hypothetical protein, partial [Shewanella sp. 11B5]|uniref:hypothetical protein n=1 Tax=Shewanella sp. 11B5 TaxID=2058298 RepID=UPI001C60A42B
SIVTPPSTINNSVTTVKPPMTLVATLIFIQYSGYYYLILIFILYVLSHITILNLLKGDCFSGKRNKFYI